MNGPGATLKRKTWRTESDGKHPDVRKIFAEAFESITERRMAKPDGEYTAGGFCTRGSQLIYGLFQTELHDVSDFASSVVRYVDYILL